MYLGFYINESFITAASMGSYNEVKLIVGDNASQEFQHLIPLQIYIEDQYVYLGKEVDYLLANDPNLQIGNCFLNKLTNPQETAYTDASGVRWNAIDLVSLFLKKIKADFHTHNDTLITGVVVTSSLPVSSQLITAFRTAFEQVRIPLCGVLDIGKPTIIGYDAFSDSKETNKAIIFNLDSQLLSFGLLQIEDQYIETQHYECDEKLGGNVLNSRLLAFMIERYDHYSNKKIKKTPCELIRAKQVVDRLMTTYATEPKPYYKVLFGFQDTMLEFIITRNQINKILVTYFSDIQKVLMRLIKSLQIELSDYNKILITGTSPVILWLKDFLIKMKDVNDLQMYFYSPNQVIIRGTVLIANNAIEREISTSLIPNVHEGFNSCDITISDEQKGMDAKKPTISIKEMHINVGCNR